MQNAWMQNACMWNALFGECMHGAHGEGIPSAVETEAENMAAGNLLDGALEALCDAIAMAPWRDMIGTPHDDQGAIAGEARLAFEGVDDRGKSLKLRGVFRRGIVA